ncbi:hypothetical protein RND71_030335 [Anisodus tanguticus]|uniref:CAND6/7 N-terminal domain-containing protein n=1 Tax=Anisodus tanguticus TaxID=243964 RepID=A0AAE1V0Z6_9SOLA|nr:hypothetical protein RND71_030335 [Anisodus tanguticus]
MTREAWSHVLEQLQDGDIRCTLHSDLVKRVFTFDQLQPSARQFTTSFSVAETNQFTLVFANCMPNLPYLQDKEKKVLMIVIPLQVVANLAQVVIDETGPFGENSYTWKQVFLLVDIVCCCAVLFPIVWSIKNLREAAKTDGKAAYQWTSVVAAEAATLAFYVFTGYNLRPKVHNPYFAIDDEEEEAASEALKLEDEFEL